MAGFVDKWELRPLRRNEGREKGCPEKSGWSRIETYNKNNISFDEVLSRNVRESAVTNDPTRGRNHGKEGRQNSFRLLQLVELDEGVEEGDGNENTTKVRVWEVILWKHKVDTDCSDEEDRKHQP